MNVFLKGQKLANRTTVSRHSPPKALALSLLPVAGLWKLVHCGHRARPVICQALPLKGLEKRPGSDVTVPSFQAHVSFKPTVAQQRKCSNCSETAVDGELVVVYDVNREEKAGELEVSAGRLQWDCQSPVKERLGLWVVSSCEGSCQGCGEGTKIVFLQNAIRIIFYLVCNSF